MKRKLLMTMVMASVLAAMPVGSVVAATVPVQTTQTRVAEGLQPRYENTINISANLAIEGNTAYAVSSWIGSSTNGTKVMERSYTLKERGTYRVYTSFDVAGEQLTFTSPTKTY